MTFSSIDFFIRCKITHKYEIACNIPTSHLFNQFYIGYITNAILKEI